MEREWYRGVISWPDDIDAYDINLREMRMENQIMIPEGEFVYYDGREFQTTEDNPTSIVHTELNKQLIRAIGFQNYRNQPKEENEDISDVCSYHINVGHGNCSIIVFFAKMVHTISGW